jgi:hypothetical protein
MREVPGVSGCSTIVIIRTLIRDTGLADLDLVDQLSNGKVDLTYGRYGIGVPDEHLRSRSSLVPWISLAEIWSNSTSSYTMGVGNANGSRGQGTLP